MVRYQVLGMAKKVKYLNFDKISKNYFGDGNPGEKTDKSLSSSSKSSASTSMFSTSPKLTAFLLTNQLDNNFGLVRFSEDGMISWFGELITKTSGTGGSGRSAAHFAASYLALSNF